MQWHILCSFSAINIHESLINSSELAYVNDTQEALKEADILSGTFSVCQQY